MAETICTATTPARMALMPSVGCHHAARRDSPDGTPRPLCQPPPPQLGNTFLTVPAQMGNVLVTKQTSVGVGDRKGYAVAFRISRELIFGQHAYEAERLIGTRR